MIKSTLMNQEILAGLGNVYVDEILYQAGIHPETKVDELSEDELSEIWDQIKRVIDVALDRQAKPEEFPDAFIIPQRHQKGRCPCCDQPLKNTKVSGRTTYFCPQRQRPTS